MIDLADTKQFGVEARARQSLGMSDAAIYKMVAGALHGRSAGGLLVDVGCGNGQLWSFVSHCFSQYIGVDVIRYDEFPSDAEFRQVDLDTGRVPLPDDIADVVASVETIEHLENPRAFMRELTRITKPGGWIIVTTPNQLSLLSLLTLIVKQRFQAFGDANYPAHLTALLEIDLARIANECGLQDIQFEYSCNGRLIFTSRHYPHTLAKLSPRAFSDNLMLMGRKQSE